MNLAKYRDTNDYREILRLFQKSSDLEGNILWQNIDGSRKVLAVTHLEIDFVSREVVVYLDQPQLVDSKHPLYFKLACNDTIFKHDQYLVQPDCLSFKFPQTLKTWELRGNERYMLDANEEFSAVLSPTAQGEVGQQMKVRLHDFSASGLGLSISEVNKNLVKNTKVFWVHAINDYRLPQPLVAKLAYISSEAQSRKYRFGLELQMGLPIEAVKSILN